MKRQNLILVALILVALLGMNLPRVQASGFFVDYSFGIGTCTSSSLSLPDFGSYSLDVTGPTFHRVDSVGGVTVLDFTGLSRATGTNTFAGTFTSQGTYSQSEPYTYTAIFDWSYSGVIFYHNVMTVTCTGDIATGIVTNTAVTQSTPVPSDTPAPGSTPAATPVPGPGIPAGFVLHRITCDTPVYDSPAGTAVGNNKITNGQTWFVNPTSVNGNDGQQWTEVFVSGFHNPFIPTSCVQ